MKCQQLTHFAGFKNEHEVECMASDPHTSYMQLHERRRNQVVNMMICYCCAVEGGRDPASYSTAECCPEASSPSLIQG
jgi:hypothetical protein